MYVIMETGGKQYKVQQGDVLTVEKLDAEAGDTVEVTKVLALGQPGGFTVGKPYVENAKVVLKVVEQGKGEKILVFKYKPKKKYRKLRGHRQPYSKVVIDGIYVDGVAQAAAVDEATAEAKPAKEAKPARRSKAAEAKAAEEAKPVGEAAVAEEVAVSEAVAAQEMQAAEEVKPVNEATVAEEAVASEAPAAEEAAAEEAAAEEAPVTEEPAADYARDE